MTVIASDYTYVAEWSDEHDAYVARCTAFPSVSWVSRDQQAALDGLRELVMTILAGMVLSGEKLPEP